MTSLALVFTFLFSFTFFSDIAFAAKEDDKKDSKPLEKLATPTKVRASVGKGSNDVRVTWKKVKGATSYTIYRSKGSAKLREYKKGVKNNQLIDKNLKGKAVYHYWVRAVNDDKKYAPSRRSSKSKGVLVKKYLTSDIRPYKWHSKTKRRTKLYASRKSSKRIGSIPRGTKVEITKMYPASVKYGSHPKRVYVKLVKNGKVVKKGWAAYRDVGGRIKAEVAYSKKTKKAYDWTKARKEEFVNSKKYSSKTRYLIWISTYTQRVNIFKGKKGHWKLIKTSRTVTGRFLHQTKIGDNFKIKRKKPKRVRNFFQKITQYYYTHLSIFHGGDAFHTVCWRLGTKIPVNSIKKNLQPGTRGCSRLPTSVAKWIYRKIPIRTRVVVY